MSIDPRIIYNELDVLDVKKRSHNWYLYWRDHTPPRIEFRVLSPLRDVSEPHEIAQILKEFEARNPEITAIHAKLVELRLVGIEVQGWPPFDAQ